jgi:CheY-like chemotaxis protein
MTPHAGGVASLRGRRVLVVDDDHDSLELARVALIRHGAEVRTETSAATASTAIASWTHDVLLCDIEMPGEEGYEFIKRLRAAGYRTPAAALTAYGRPEDRVRALAAGFDVHIAKPVDPDTLATLVGELIGAAERG